MSPLAGIDANGWSRVVEQLIASGWVRIESVVDSHDLDSLERAAPPSWAPLPQTEGSAGVRQAGRGCHSSIAEAGAAVRSLADAIRTGIDSVAADGVEPLPAFNHANWCRSDRDRHFITPHRDPDTAGGVVAIVTLRGHATFRVWDLDCSLDHAERHPELASQWTTNDGDLVLLRVGGWPQPHTRCPIHEAESPLLGERVTLTLRHNKGGYGADYFS